MKREKIRKRMRREEIDALLITNETNLRYLTNFTGSGACIITEDSGFLITDSRYVEQAGLEADDYDIACVKVSLAETLAEILVREKRVAFESNYVSFSMFRQLKDRLKCNLVPVEEWVEKLRAVKTEDEEKLLKIAAGIVDEAFAYALKVIMPGRKEKDIALELEYFIRKKKKADISFNIILVSGTRASLVHGSPSSKILRQGDIVLLDMGAGWGGYCSDLTRTICLGRMSCEQKRVYELVLRAQEEAIAAIRPGMSASGLHSTARRIIEKSNFSLGHGLGHGIGLDVHEYPRIGRGSRDVIRQGMVVTVEPGIYIPGKFGVRIEDMVLLRQNGSELLTHSPKHVIEL